MKKQKFRIGGIEECMILAIFLTFGYLFMAVQFGLPLVKSDLSPVFATFFLGIPLSFFGLSTLELLWFERDLDWNGRKKRGITQNSTNTAPN